MGWLLSHCLVTSSAIHVNKFAPGLKKDPAKLLTS